ncbi:MAG: hypothetical protein E7313_01280 [Clostridiales bacterium]|nr:hypothetical protein [Clostridiales bacterium]
MIRSVAKELLDLMKNNKGVELSQINNKTNTELLQIIEIILSECRCSIIDDKGNYSRFGSSTDIRIIRILVQILLSNSNKIPSEVVSMALTKENVLGPLKEVNIEKKYNKETGTYGIEIEKIFPNEFNVGIFKNNLEVREMFIENIIKPYVKNIIYEDEKLSSKCPIGTFISKKISKQKTNEELLKDLNNILQKALKTDIEAVENISSYIFINIMNNKLFKIELINRTLNTTELQKLGRVYNGFNSLVENMVSEVLQMIELRSFPYGEIISIKDTFYTIISVLKALSINLEELNEEEILNQIEQVNKNYNISNRSKKTELYRTKKTLITKYGIAIDVIDVEKIQSAMKNLCIEIKKLLNRREDLSIEEYINEVIRLHYRFLRIQPFEKSNGRTARALVNMLLQCRNRIVYFSKEERNKYIDALNEANKIIQKNEGLYLKNLDENPAECIELENEFLNLNLDFLN